MSAGVTLDAEAAEHGGPWNTDGTNVAALAPRDRGSIGERLWALVPSLDMAALFLVASLAGATGTMSLDYAAVGLAALAARGAYRVRLRPTTLDAVPDRLAAAAIATAAAAAVRIYGEHLPAPDPAQLLALALGGTAVLVAVRGVAVELLRGAWRTGGRAPAVVVGHGVVAEGLERALLADRACGLDPIATAANPAAVAQAIRRHGARHVVIAFSAQRDAEVTAVVRVCEELGVRVWVVPRLFDVINHRSTYEAVGGLPVLGLRAIRRDDWRYTVKHAIDRIAAAVLIVAAAPVLAACALAVRLDSPGPILYRQRRVGCDGAEFQILKFRSMCPGGPASPAGLRLVTQTAPGGVEGGDDRRTRVGAFLRRSSLDELPQLFNVLRGEMSLVGPRPERPEYVRAFHDVGRYAERHRVRSGITGWAQVHGLRGKTSIADRAAFDNHYIEHWSLWLDVKILALTVLAVLRPAE